MGHQAVAVKGQQVGLLRQQVEGIAPIEVEMAPMGAAQQPAHLGPVGRPRPAQDQICTGAHPLRLSESERPWK